MRHSTPSLLALLLTSLAISAVALPQPAALLPKRQAKGCQAVVELGVGYVEGDSSGTVDQVSLTWISVTSGSDFHSIGGASPNANLFFPDDPPDSGAPFWLGLGGYPDMLVISWTGGNLQFNYGAQVWGATDCSWDNALPAHGGTCMQISPPSDPENGFFKQQIAVNWTC